MKYLLVLVLCFASAMTVMSWRPWSCKSDDDCDEDECCIGGALISGCHSLLDENETCNIYEKGQKKHTFVCPCKNGLECGYTSEMKILAEKKLVHPICMKPSAKSN